MYPRVRANPGLQHVPKIALFFYMSISSSSVFGGDANQIVRVRVAVVAGS